MCGGLPTEEAVGQMFPFKFLEVSTPSMRGRVRGKRLRSCCLRRSRAELLYGYPAEHLSAVPLFVVMGLCILCAVRPKVNAEANKLVVSNRRAVLEQEMKELSRGDVVEG